MKTTKETLREDIIHELGMCIYGCDGNPHKNAMDGDERAEIDKVMELVESYAKSENEEKLKRLREKSFIALKSEMSRAIAWSIVEKELTREDK